MSATITSEGSAADAALARAEWQRTIFAEPPRRVDLLRLQAPWPTRGLRVAILRNHSIEQVLRPLQTFLAYAGLSADFRLSDYDDSLGTSPAADADVHVVWPDFSRYHTLAPADIERWVTERVGSLRRELEGPVLVVGPLPGVTNADVVARALAQTIERLPDACLLRPDELLSGSGGLTDTREHSLGTTMSSRSALSIARELGLRWIPAMTRPRLKAIVVDLDNTLISGVLAEDGLGGIVVDDAHLSLHDRLALCCSEGILLALASKNEPADVAPLLADEGPLRLLRGRFAATEVGWHDKAESVRRIADCLRIAVDSVLFVDDNPGEIAAVAEAHKGIHTLLATNPEETARALELFPGLLSLRVDDAASLRQADLAAAGRRDAELRSATDRIEYLRSLRAAVLFQLDRRADRHRVHELCAKTNQFNTTLYRVTEAELNAYGAGTTTHMVTVRLRDRLSDSGLIAAILTRVKGQDLVVDVAAVSCRALGRQLETLYVLEPVRRLAELVRPRRVLVPAVEGPRNQPALHWLSELGMPWEDRCLVLPGAPSEIAALIPALPVDVSWTEIEGE